MDVAHSSQLQELNIIHVWYALHAQRPYAAIAHCTCNIMRGAVVSNGRTIVAVSLKGQDTETSSHFILTWNM
jgi:hypothetical protein